MIAIDLDPWQYEAFFSEEPTVCAVTPIGEGKSWLGAHWLVHHAIANPDAGYLATGNSAKQIERVILPNLVKAAEDYQCQHTHRVQAEELVVERPDGRKGVIWFGSVNSDAVIERIRGVELGKAWMDEIRDTPRYAYEVVSGRMRDPSEPNPQILATTTPAGFNWIHDVFVSRGDEADPTGRKLRKLIHVTKRSARSVKRLPAGYDSGLRGTYDEQLARQELEAAFVAIGQGAVFYAFDRGVHVRPCPYDANAPLALSCDFNNEMMSWVVIQPHGREVWVVDEIRAPWIPDAARIFRERYGRPFVLYGDPAGKSRNHASITDYGLVTQELRDIFRGDMRVATSDPGFRARANVVNALLRRDAPRLFVDPRCQLLIRDLERMAWAKDGAVFDKTDRSMSHFADALAYYCCYEHSPTSFRDEPGYRP